MIAHELLERAVTFTLRVDYDDIIDAPYARPRYAGVTLITSLTDVMMRERHI